METEYDYINQAWTQDGRYIRCGHPDEKACRCYGRLHEGERTAIRTLTEEES